MPPQMDVDLHSPQRRLIELKMEHADLDNVIDLACEGGVVGDQLAFARLKKRRLALRDLIAKFEASIEPKEPA